ARIRQCGHRAAARVSRYGRLLDASEQQTVAARYRRSDAAHKRTQRSVLTRARAALDERNLACGDLRFSTGRRTRWLRVRAVPGKSRMASAAAHRFLRRRALLNREPAFVAACVQLKRLN